MTHVRRRDSRTTITRNLTSHLIRWEFNSADEREAESGGGGGEGGEWGEDKKENSESVAIILPQTEEGGEKILTAVH